MTTMSLSFTVATTYAPPAAAKPATEAVRKTAPVPADDSHCEEKRPVARQNRLEQAMMAALRELGFGGATAATPAASAAPTTTTPAANPTATTAAADTSTTASDAGSVESAVHQFAHALFQALRQNGGADSKAPDGDSGRAEGRHRHHHHHPEGRGYGDMSQRLEALSQTVGAPAVASTLSTTPAVATAPGSAAVPATASAATSSSLSVTLTVDDGSAAAATGPATAATMPATPVTTAVAPAKSPLLDAFTKLFNVLKPQASTGAAATPATDMAEKLRQFLHTLAQAMAPNAMGSVQQAQVGGLVNVTA